MKTLNYFLVAGCLFCCSLSTNGQFYLLQKSQGEDNILLLRDNLHQEQTKPDFLQAWQVGLWDFLNGPNDDDDGDGLKNWEEQLIWGTDPLKKDTDGDGLDDFEECIIYGTNPLDKNTDKDGLWDGEEVHKYGTNPLKKDTDGDGLNDGAEVLYWGTDPTKKSTDGDPYDDMMEIMGYDKDGNPMPAYVKAPGNNVFVAAYPVITVVVDNNVSVQEIPVLYFGTEEWREGSVGYSVANMTGYSLSVGTTDSHTTGGWEDLSNEESDATTKSNYQDQVNKTESKYWTGYSTNTSVEAEVGAEVGGSNNFSRSSSICKSECKCENFGRGRHLWRRLSRRFSD